MTYNHAFTVGFAVPGSKYEKWDDCLVNEMDEVLLALERRIKELRSNKNEYVEAVDGFDSYEE